MGVVVLDGAGGQGTAEAADPKVVQLPEAARKGTAWQQGHAAPAETEVVRLSEHKASRPVKDRHARGRIAGPWLIDFDAWPGGGRR